MVDELAIHVHPSSRHAQRHRRRNGKQLGHKAMDSHMQYNSSTYLSNSLPLKNFVFEGAPDLPVCISGVPIKKSEANFSWGIS
jgi:hypothetical protein